MTTRRSEPLSPTDSGVASPGEAKMRPRVMSARELAEKYGFTERTGDGEPWERIAFAADNEAENCKDESRVYLDLKHQVESERDRLRAELEESKASEHAERVQKDALRITLEATTDSLRELRSKLEATEATSASRLTELQQLYAAFEGSGHSPKNPREAAQAIGQMADGEAELPHQPPAPDSPKHLTLADVDRRIAQLARAASMRASVDHHSTRRALERLQEAAEKALSDSEVGK